jgi:thiol-disulfide isomerase/thioredoxin
MELQFFSSMFCEPCMHTRTVLDEVRRLMPDLTIREYDVATNAPLAEVAGVRSTPTVVLLDDNRHEKFRASGEPTVNQVLVAIAKAL